MNSAAGLPGAHLAPGQRAPVRAAGGPFRDGELRELEPHQPLYARVRVRRQDHPHLACAHGPQPAQLARGPPPWACGVWSFRLLLSLWYSSTGAAAGEGLQQGTLRVGLLGVARLLACLPGVPEQNGCAVRHLEPLQAAEVERKLAQFVH